MSAAGSGGGARRVPVRRSALMDVQMSRLPGGARVITSRIPHVQSLSAGVWVAAGGRHEPAPLAGISHFIEHMLFKGTARRSARDLSQEIEGRGGDLNAFTQEECTCYFARVTADQFGRAADVLADMYLHSRFDPAEIARERAVIGEEIRMYRDQPPHLVQDLLTEALWPGHPLGAPVSGTPETVARIARADLVRFRRRGYVGANTVFAFAGQLEHADAVELTRSLFARLPPGAPLRGRPVSARIRQRAYVEERRAVEQTQVALGVRLFGRHDPRRFALRVLNAVLGENMSSRLFQELREKRGLAYTISSGVHLFAESGALVVSAGLEPRHQAQGLRLMARELSRLRTHPVGREELRRAKEYVIGQVKLGLESTSNHMMWIGENVLTYGRFITPEDAMRDVAAVTAAEVQAVAQAVFRRQALSLALVWPGPERGAGAGAREALAGL